MERKYSSSFIYTVCLLLGLEISSGELFEPRCNLIHEHAHLVRHLQAEETIWNIVFVFFVVLQDT